MKLNHQELMRYSRQIILKEVGESGQEKLKNAAVLCVGAGGIGSPVLLYLAAAGVGKIGVIDHDVVDLSNLQRQILFSEKDIHHPKSDTACATLQKHNSSITFISYPEKLTVQNALRIFSEYDVILDASDNFYCKYLSSDVSKHLGKPLVLASVYQFAGQLSVFNYQDGPCYRCLYPSAPPIPNCMDAGVLGVLPGIIGTLAANEVLKIVLSIGEILSGFLLTFDALSSVTKKMKLEKSASCVTAHCQSADTACVDSTQGNVDCPNLSISPHALLKLMQNNKRFLIVDVREAWEMASGSIPGSKNIPLQQIAHFSPENNVITIFYCRSGYRSMQAVRLLMRKGCNNILSLEGGITKWTQNLHRRVRGDVSKVSSE